MTWSDRQLAMLRELGVRVWQRAPGAPMPAVGAGVIEPPAVHPAASAAQLVPPSLPPAAEVLVAREPVARPSSFHPTSVQADAAPAPAAPPAAGLGWDELRDAVAACRACTLCEKRRQTVFGVGHVAAHWMVVGEAPGEQEDQRGEPFVGPSGQLLDNMLRALGLTRAAADAGGAPLPPAQHVYIANSVKCRPPSNRNPSPDEIARCEPFLVRQIELLRPRVILAMGRFAVQALLRSDEPIGRLRGRVHRYQGVPLIVTYHPAYLLRSPVDKARAWEDLCLAARTMDSLGPV